MSKQELLQLIERYGDACVDYGCGAGEGHAVSWSDACEGLWQQIQEAVTEHFEEKA